jgi:hypothetical protein
LLDVAKNIAIDNMTNSIISIFVLKRDIDHKNILPIIAMNEAKTKELSKENRILLAINATKAIPRIILNPSIPPLPPTSVP